MSTKQKYYIAALLLTLATSLAMNAIALQRIADLQETVDIIDNNLVEATNLAQTANQKADQLCSALNRDC